VKCPRCGSETRVLETRERDADLTLRRKRECTERRCRHRFWTGEAHCSALGRSSWFQARRHAETCRRRWALLARDAQIASELHKGWQPLAQRYAITRAAVYLAASRGRRWLRKGC
jgi:hypothetical protein